MRRLPERGAYDAETIHGILDEALVGHLGFVSEGQPFVIPTFYAREGRSVYVHGSAAGRLFKTLGTGTPMCLTVTLLDGLVLARSAFHHSMNYRSVVILAKASAVEDPEAKKHALDVIVERLLRGRSRDVRGPNANELKATTVLSLPIDEASAKIRTGPPKDDAEDYALPCWAGVLPLRLVGGTPVPDDGLVSGVVAPPGLSVDPRWSSGETPAESQREAAGGAAPE